MKLQKINRRPTYQSVYNIETHNSILIKGYEYSSFSWIAIITAAAFDAIFITFPPITRKWRVLIFCGNKWLSKGFCLSNISESLCMTSTFISFVSKNIAKTYMPRTWNSVDNYDIPYLYYGNDFSIWKSLTFYKIHRTVTLQVPVL